MKHRPAGELILFIKVGQSPFRDSVHTISPDGHDLNQFLTPEWGRSYLYASGSSLQDILAVSVHEIDSTGQVVDHLFTYDPRNGQWRRLINMDGLEGHGFLSPDRSRVAFIFAPNAPRIQLRPWVANLNTGETVKLTDDDAEEGMWDGYLSWRPDGQEIAFLRMRSTPAGVAATLVHVPASGGKPTEVLEPEENVAAACYGPDGNRLAMLTRHGLEVLEIASRQRQLILPWAKLNGAQFRAGGLIWSKALDAIAFAVFNQQAKRYELWTISSDGNNPRVIYSQDEADGQLVVSSFIQS